ncbi:hypothetical protein [Phocaeicola sp.]
MLVVFLLLFSILCIALNVNVPHSIADANRMLVFLAGGLMLWGAFAIIQIRLRNYSDKVKKSFFSFFLLSFIIAALYLHYSWCPYLVKMHGSIAFDPQRYYEAMFNIIKYGNTNVGMNYFGVVYFYAFFMKMFGLSPIIALYVNSLLVLYASIELSILLRGRMQKGFHLFALMMVIPEIIYFNCMTSREIICTTSVVIIIVNLYRLLTRFDMASLLVAMSFFFLLFVVRPPFALVVLLCLGIYMMLVSKRKKRMLLLLLPIFCIAILAFQYSESIGSSNEALQDQLEASTQGSSTSDAANYSQNSISKALIPHNIIEFVIFGFVRSFAYIIVSPSMITNPINALSFDIGQSSFFTSLTSLLMLICIPVIYRERKKIYKIRRLEFKIILISLVVYFFVVGTFMASFIHIRYRLVYDMLYFGVVLYLYITSKRYRGNHYQNKKNENISIY